MERERTNRSNASHERHMAMSLMSSRVAVFVKCAAVRDRPYQRQHHRCVSRLRPPAPELRRHRRQLNAANVSNTHSFFILNQ